MKFFMGLVVCMFCFVGYSTADVDCSTAVIHHTASPDWGVDKIREIHVKENGWDDIGYHFLIRANGDIEYGRPLSKNGAHAKGRNHLVGIALTGYDDFTEQQFGSLIFLLGDLGVKNVVAHHEKCPGPGLGLEAINLILKESIQEENI